MFLALKEMRHSKTRFLMIGAIIMLIGWLVFILSGLGNGLSSLAAATMKNIDGDLFIYEEESEAAMMKTKVSGSIADDIVGKIMSSKQLILGNRLLLFIMKMFRM